MAKRERSRRTGRYTFGGRHERACVCGRAFGVHDADAPHAFGDYALDPRPLPECPGFRPAKKTRKKNPTQKDRLDRAAKLFEKFHWGDEPTETTEERAPRVRPGEVLYLVGTLVEVVYETHKDGKTSDFVHEFEEPYPMLASTIDGELVIVGGGYKITPRGIVG